MKITFLGAVDVVTGSRYFIEQNNLKILVDCGLFQGDKNTRKRNWDQLAIDPASINAVILTHAHIDHSGYLPVLVKKGFKGPIYCTQATYDLCTILLIDSARLQADEVRKSRKYSMHKLPLYTEEDAKRTFSFFKIVDFGTKINIQNQLSFTLISAGHILGAAFVILTDGKKTLTFTGDIGRPNQLLMKAPTKLEQTDYLVLDSTYGNRLHGADDPIQALGELINKTVQRNGLVVIPSFAVGRAQALLYCLYTLKQNNAIPDIPIYLDSPMAIKVTNLYCRFVDQIKLSSGECRDVFSIAVPVDNERKSKRLHNLKNPAIIIAGSGMSDGGRMLDHLTYFVSNSKNTIIFVGYQAEGTIGRKLVDGTKRIKLYRKYYSVRAEIDMIDSFSAHADYNELLTWLANFKKAPGTTFLSHGDRESVESLKKKIEKRFGWKVIAPKYGNSFDLD